jgi:hypothetical protein
MISLDTHLIKVLFLLSFFFAEEGALICQTESTKELTGFRNSLWGSSVNEVKSKETENYLQTFIGFGVYALSYKSTIAGLAARMDYTFKRFIFV